MFDKHNEQKPLDRYVQPVITDLLSSLQLLLTQEIVISNNNYKESRYQGTQSVSDPKFQSCQVNQIKHFIITSVSSFNPNNMHVLFLFFYMY